MASPEVTSMLAALSDSSSPQSNKSSTGYTDLLNQITSTPDSPQLIPNLTAFIDAILGETLGIVAARPLLASAVTAIKTLSSPEAKIEVGTHALRALESRGVSFEEQDAELRYALADAYEAREDWLESAKVLQGIQLESSQRRIDDHEKVGTWIRICRLYLEDDNTTTAETYLNRAKNSLYKVDDLVLKINFQLSRARILDSQKKFLEASSAYHSISFIPSIDEEERLKTLSMAITCAVLAPAGPQRSRCLAKLYKDERATQVQEFGILEKMFLDRLLSTEEVDKFAAGLSPHQLAKTADGSTVLAKAVVEHNLLSASRLYSNIGVNELGVLLGLDAEKAEEYASAMLQQGRLSGRIDQIDGVIFFDGRHGLQAVGKELRKWDGKVQGVAEEVERVASMLQAQYPVSLSQRLCGWFAEGYDRILPLLIWSK
ncbi:MAG: hypothetical protein Q9217_003388 [Psora testacea]